jgi:hypothetical protein
MSQRAWRLGIYECKIENGVVLPLGDSSIWCTYVPFPPTDVADYRPLVYDELTKYDRASRPFQYPILVMSWRLGPGEHIENKVKPEDRHSIFASRVGGVRGLKKLVGPYIKRVEVPGTRRQEVVIFKDGLITKIENGYVVADRE